MAEYREIQGAAVQSLASSTGTIEGQIWYDNVNGAFKLQAFQAASWASGVNINTSRSQLAGAGTQTAGLIFGGTPPNSSNPSATNGAKTEQYDGSSWTEVNDKNNATRQQSGFGIQTAAVSFGGYSDGAGGYRNITEEWDGTCWAAGNNYPSSISNGAGGSTGILTAALNVLGYNGTAYTNNTNEYDGTSWTAGGTYPLPQGQNGTQFGTLTAAVGVGGFVDPGSSQVTAHYDGSSWTAVNNLPVVANQNGRCGTQNDGMIYGGNYSTSYSSSSYLYDGTSWTTNPASLSTGRSAGGPATSQGSSSGAFLAGGDLAETTTYAVTEEFTSAGVGTETITTT